MDSSTEDELLSLDSDSDIPDDQILKKKSKRSKNSDQSQSERSEQVLATDYSHANDDDALLDRPDSALGSDTVPSCSISCDDGLGSSFQNSTFTEDEQGTEITLSDDEDEGVISVNGTSSISSSTVVASTSDPPSSGGGEVSSATCSYSLRRKRKVDYGELENGPGNDDLLNEPKFKLKKDVLDVFSLSSTIISKYIRKPDLIDNHTKCKIVFMDGTDSSRINHVSKFFEKCGPQFESLYVQIRYNEENYGFLKLVFKHTPSLSRLDYRYQNQEDAFHLLTLLKNMRESKLLSSLTSLKLVSVSGSESLHERHIDLLSKMNIQLHSVELGDALWEDVKVPTVEKFLERQKTCLETFIINGGFRGDTDKEKILISFPKLEVLKNLCICPKYTFLSEFKNPYSKKARVISLDIQPNEEPYKIAIKFTCDLPKLQRLVLGNMVDIEDLVFSSVRKLVEFRCGSFWNLSIRFPSEGSRKALMESTVTEFQFPDALKDPLFTVQVAKHFPNLKKVCLYLPSVPVLRAFFKAFENSQLEELYLKTQFDFEKTMESCLLPNMRDVLQKSRETETILQTLREYKHFDEYIRYYNVELPLEAEHLMEGHSAGIGALKSLKILHLEHIPRTLLIPIPDDERKWYDHNCKFMSTTFGYEKYPLNQKCHKEILKLDLSEYIWKNIEISSRYTEEFYEAGFVDIPARQVGDTFLNVRDFCWMDATDEDIFTPIQKSTPKGAQVKILPSMLLPTFKAKPEDL